MSKDPQPPFSDLVTARLSPDQEEARTLWFPLAQELNRTGPDAVNEYLDAAKQALEDRLKSLLDNVEGEIDG